MTTIVLNNREQEFDFALIQKYHELEKQLKDLKPAYEKSSATFFEQLSSGVEDIKNFDTRIQVGNTLYNVLVKHSKENIKTREDYVTDVCKKRESVKEAIQSLREFDKNSCEKELIEVELKTTASVDPLFKQEREIRIAELTKALSVVKKKAGLTCFNITKLSEI
jgi:hypothetical protein